MKAEMPQIANCNQASERAGGLQSLAFPTSLLPSGSPGSRLVGTGAKDEIMPLEKDGPASGAIRLSFW